MSLVLVDFEDGRLNLTLNRPDKRNAITRPMLWELIDALARSRRDPEVRVVVLRGAAGYFSAGIDLPDAVASGKEEAPIRLMRLVAEAVTDVFRTPMPCLSVIEGGAFGLGANIALAADLTVMAEDAILSELFIHRALSVDGGGAWLLPRLVGLKRAKELVLLGENITAAEALEIGLVNRVLPSSDIDAFVDDWVEQLANFPPVALSLSKGLLNDAYGRSFEQSIEDEGRAQHMNSLGEDAKEGLRAAMEKRPPRFTGR